MFKLNPFSSAPVGLKRLFAHNPRVDTNLSYEYEEITFVPEDQANLVTSATGSADWHLPVLDLDVPHKLEPSSTPGHSHLYIDVPVKWDDYVQLLRLLAKMDIIEYGYADASIAKGATMVRKPGVVKGGPPVPEPTAVLTESREIYGGYFGAS